VIAMAGVFLIGLVFLALALWLTSERPKRWIERRYRRWRNERPPWS
jgi:hypothetical protein